MTIHGTMDIGEVATRSKTKASTLRYYEELGLIQSVGRHGLRRQYDTMVIDQLAFIKLARIAGFSLQEIANMTTKDNIFQVDREKLSKRADSILRQIGELKTLHAMITHTIHCPEDNHFNCPKFTQMLRLAPHYEERKSMPPKTPRR